MTAITRREALKSAGVVLGGIALASNGLLTGCSAEPHAAGIGKAQLALSVEDEALLESIADTILPDTSSSPGAKAAGVGAAINLLLSDVYAVTARTRITDGLTAIRARCSAEFGRGFALLPTDRRAAFLTTIDTEAKAAGEAHWFHLMHELSLKAYFSSEVGMTKALRYVHEPGRFTGCVPLAKGQPAWA